MKDIDGQSIKVGSKVAFAVRKGSTTALITGTVKEVGLTIHPDKSRKGCTVVAHGGRESYKEGHELIVYGHKERVGDHYTAGGAR